MSVLPPSTSTGIQRIALPADDPSTPESIMEIDYHSRIERHTDAMPLNQETCLARCFTAIKTKILRFFNWLCSLYRSEKSLKEKTSEIQKNDSTPLQTEAPLSNDKTSNRFDTLASDEEIRLVRKKITEEIINVGFRAQKTFNSLSPNPSDEETVTYLAHMIKIQERMYELRKIDDNLESDPMLRIHDQTGKSDPVTKNQLQEENEKITGIVDAIPNDLQNLNLTSVDTEMHETVKKFTIGDIQYIPYHGPEHLLEGLNKPLAERLLVMMNKIRADTDKRLKPLELPKYVW
jgi:hypothetical protein